MHGVACTFVEFISCNYFFDEIDCLVSSRNSGENASGVQGELLTQLNNIKTGVFIIAAWRLWSENLKLRSEIFYKGNIFEQMSEL